MTDNYNNTAYYLRKRGEMCSITDCDECPLSENNNGKSLNCNLYEQRHPAEAVVAVREWYRGEAKVTYRDDFLDKYPKATKKANGYPAGVFACTLYPEITDRITDCSSDCKQCWDMEM